MADMQIPSRLLSAVWRAVVYDNWQQTSVTGSEAYKAAQTGDVLTL